MILSTHETKVRCRSDDTAMSPDTGYEPLMDSRTTILSHSRNDSGATIDKNRLVSARSPATSSSEALDQQPKKPKHWLGIRRWVWFTLFVGFGSAAIAGVIVGVVISHSEGDKLSSSAASSGSGSTAASPTSTHPTVATGKTGDYYKLTNGSTVQFKSAVGGTFDTTGANSARASDTSPALSEAWDFDNDRMIGVNLGGWLSLEPVRGGKCRFLLPHAVHHARDLPALRQLDASSRR